MKVAVIMFVLGVTLIHYSEGLKCFVCKSAGCKDEQDCAGSCGNSTSTVAGAAVTVQSCSPTKITDKCTDQDIAGVKTKVCFCNKDLCNAAPRQFSAPGTALAVLVLAVAAMARL